MTVQAVQATVPAAGSHASIEDLVWGIDCSALLGTGQTMTGVAVVLSSGGSPVTLVDSPTVSGSVISQRIRAGVLAAGLVYELTATFTPSSTTNVFACRLELTVPF